VDLPLQFLGVRLLVQLLGFEEVQIALQPDTIAMCCGRLQLATFSNMWSWRTKS
jgi:hypothetical protein